MSVSVKCAALLCQYTTSDRPHLCTIDYIAVAGSFDVCASSLSRIDSMLLSDNDHHPIFVRLEFSESPHVAPSRRRPLDFDPNLIGSVDHDDILLFLLCLTAVRAPRTATSWTRIFVEHCL